MLGARRDAEMGHERTAEGRGAAVSAAQRRAGVRRILGAPPTRWRGGCRGRGQRGRELRMGPRRPGIR